MDLFLKVFVIFICGVLGFFLSITDEIPDSQMWIFPAIFAGASGVSLFLLKYIIKLPAKRIIGGFLGFVFGIGLGYIVTHVFVMPFADDPFFLTAVYVIFGYAGLKIGERKGPELFSSFLTTVTGSSGFIENYRILDTSVIIDGRIPDVVESGFIDGIFIVPQYVLNELQHIADSSDPIKRVRGRRGMEVLNRLQKFENIEVRIVEKDYPKIKDVDSKLIALTKEIGGRLVTTDYNLHKLAELQGLLVLNINQLATSLKPFLLPGELLKVKVIKEGTEQGQGVGYLDDGTMVVVENGRRFIGKNVDVMVTSVLQNPSGRIFFSKIREEGES
ncbi:MAG TPA: TRAM domain-containing protein [bacterium]